MAISTQTRRRSTLAVLPVPDSAVGSADRRQVTWNYSGIATGSGTSNDGPWYQITAAGGSWKASPVVASTWKKPGAGAGSWSKPSGVAE